jgi:ribosomal protein L37AE/L43A
MQCEFGGHDVPSLIHLWVYTDTGIWVCADCYKVIDSHRYKPCSKVMDKLALVEAGYQVNRKLAKLARLRRRMRIR